MNTRQKIAYRACLIAGPVFALWSNDASNGIPFIAASIVIAALGRKDG